MKDLTWTEFVFNCRFCDTLKRAAQERIDEERHGHDEGTTDEEIVKTWDVCLDCTGGYEDHDLTGEEWEPTTVLTAATDKVARAFLDDVQTSLKQAEWEEAVAVIRRDGFKDRATSWCPFHDYVDANMNMEAAIEKVCGDINEDDAHTLWNLAYERAHEILQTELNR
jgi:hypothetical protein